METIVNTMIEGLSQRMIQARLNSLDVLHFWYTRLFPLKRVNGFAWKLLQNQVERRNVAGDIHTDNGTIVRKRRPIFESAQGDIPYIAISREMTRSQIKDYQTARAYAPDSSAVEMVDYWADDVDYCFNGIQSELEYIALSLVSNAGELSFTTTNNATFANEFNLNYYVYDWQKKKSSSDWGNGATADILGDLRSIIEDAFNHGLNPRYAFVNKKTLYKICSADQIIKACASYIANAVGIAQTPGIEEVNMMLKKQPWMNGLELIMIDQDITRELKDGTSTGGNPFADDRMVLSNSRVLGTTQYDLLQDNQPMILKAVRGNTTIKKYGNVEPLSEITIGEADAIPVLDSAYRNIYIKTDGNDW